MMTMPARQLVAKTLRFMIHTLFWVRALGAPTPCITKAGQLRVHEIRKPIQQVRARVLREKDDGFADSAF